LVSLACLGAAAFSGCGDKPIGQPCNFGWPKDSSGNYDCNAYPACHPLQETAGGGIDLNNRACPIDCIQMPSLECENLICVATQIEGDAVHMNGRCGTDVNSPDCASAPFGCMGYCTKECLTDASCPKDYKCSAMAPFGQTLACTVEAQWGTACTASCIPTGQSPAGTSVSCPNTDPAQGEVSYVDCDIQEYATCCACICYQFCPILTKKFCRKEGWDDGMFPDAITQAGSCGE